MRDIITLLEEKSKPQDIEIIPLNFTPAEVSPVLSKDTLDLHQIQKKVDTAGRL